MNDKENISFLSIWQRIPHYRKLLNQRKRSEKDTSAAADMPEEPVTKKVKDNSDLEAVKRVETDKMLSGKTTHVFALARLRSVPHTSHHSASHSSSS